MKQTKPLHVAVAVIKDFEGNILISLRDEIAHQGGLWEFPGGKVEPGESAQQALIRELKEELGMRVSLHHLIPLIKIQHQYTDLKVLLDVWTVTRFSGTPIGREGQAIKWISPEQLTDYPFPKANDPIITAARLPSDYAILNAEDQHTLLKNLNTILSNGVKLIQFRIKLLSAEEVMRFIELALPLCKERGVSVLINSAVKGAENIAADGIHLTTHDLLALKKRPDNYTLVAASCHNKQELQHAEKIAVDFVVLAPVKLTSTHPDSKTLGWMKFEALISEFNLPVFALGGLQKMDKITAQRAGAQGVAGISTFLGMVKE